MYLVFIRPPRDAMSRACRRRFRVILALSTLTAFASASAGSTWLDGQLKAIAGSNSLPISGNSRSRRGGGDAGGGAEDAVGRLGGDSPADHSPRGLRPDSGRVSRLPTKCGDFKLGLTPSMLKVGSWCDIWLVITSPVLTVQSLEQKDTYTLMCTPVLRPSTV